LDYFFPHENGVEIAKTLAGKNFGLPIILLTSNKDFRIAIEAMKYGVEDYLLKEEAVDSILPRTIVSVLERKKLDRQRLEAEKQERLTHKANEAIQELIVTMCHEFNNPLAAIKISTDILLRQKVSEDQKATLVKLNSHINHLEKQIIKLRDLNVAKPSSAEAAS
jgi:FixJ family two-component response regulator